jgi:hypothetical protein
MTSDRENAPAEGSAGRSQAEKDALLTSKRLQLDLTSRSIISHRATLWEEEKHYTWWVYVIAAALVLVGTSAYPPVGFKVVFVAAGSLVGIVVSLLGLCVVRREGELIHGRHRAYDRLIDELGLEDPERGLEEGQVNCSVSRLLSPISEIRKGALGVRYVFQLGFLFTAVLYLAGFSFAVVFGIVRAIIR